MKTSFSRAMKNYLVKNNYHSTTQDVRKLRVIILVLIQAKYVAVGEQCIAVES